MDRLHVAIGYSYVDYFTIETEWADFCAFYGKSDRVDYVYEISTPHSNNKIGWEVNEIRAFDSNGIATTYSVGDSSGSHGANVASNIRDSNIGTYWEAVWDDNRGKHWVTFANSVVLSRFMLYQSQKLQQTVAVGIGGTTKKSKQTHTQKKKIFFFFWFSCVCVFFIFLYFFWCEWEHGACVTLKRGG